MKKYNPLVSVVIPTFNVEKYIEDTVSSVLNQSYNNFEIIVVDDSSNDRTVEIVKELSGSDRRIKYFQIAHAGRPSVPRNFGIRKSAGELIAFLDGDDLWTKNKLKDQVASIENNSACAFVYSMSVTTGASLFSSYYEVLPLLHKAVRSFDDLIIKGNSITCSSVLVKKTFLEKVNGFDEDPLLAVDDYDLWIRLSKTGSIGFISKIHVYYRVHPAQFSSDWETKQKRLNYLSSKRNIPIPKYKYFRNKGIVFRILRNLLHFFTFLAVKFLPISYKNS